jgi:catechol 2,3-dioxygenase-like lactoylglutathione lyase family enzyme
LKKSLFPVVCSANVRTAQEFYMRLLSLNVVFESEWYVQLQDASDPGVQLGFVVRDHGTVPEAFRRPAQGVLITFEVDDVDALYARALELRLPIALSLRDEKFGQRHFMTVDPDGLLVDVVKIIPFDPEFAAEYGIPS